MQKEHGGPVKLYPSLVNFYQNYTFSVNQRSHWKEHFKNAVYHSAVK